MITNTTLFFVWWFGAIIFAITFLPVWITTKKKTDDELWANWGLAKLIAADIVLSLIWPIVLIILLVVGLEKMLLKSKFLEKLDDWLYHRKLKSLGWIILLSALTLSSCKKEDTLGNYIRYSLVNFLPYEEGDTITFYNVVDETDSIQFVVDKVKNDYYNYEVEYAQRGVMLREIPEAIPTISMSVRVVDRSLFEITLHRPGIQSERLHGTYLSNGRVMDELNQSLFTLSDSSVIAGEIERYIGLISINIDGKRYEIADKTMVIFY